MNDLATPDVQAALVAAWLASCGLHYNRAALA